MEGFSLCDCNIKICNLNKKSARIVVSRFNEDISWLPWNDNRFNITVYNKGSTYIPNSIKLPNVGSCDYTYLYHIINNYDHLDDITIFCSGSTNLHERKRKMFDKIISTKLSNTMFIGNYDSISVHDNFTIDEWVTSSDINKIEGESYKLTPCSIRPFGAWRKEIIGERDANFATYGGIFAIHKNHIQQYPKSLYEKIISYVDKDKFTESSHYVERIWPHLVYPYPEECKINL